MRTVPAFLTAILVLASGCTVCNRCDDFACECRDSYRGYTAWSHWRPVYAGVANENDFRSGFQAGYSAVALRGESQTPETPPHRYQTVFYHSEVGRAQLQSWHDGYAHGAVVARQEGVEQWSRTRGDTIGRDAVGHAEIAARTPKSTPHKIGIRTAVASDDEWQPAGSLDKKTPRLPKTLPASGTDHDKVEAVPEFEDPSQPFAPRFSPSARGE